MTNNSLLSITLFVGLMAAISGLATTASAEVTATMRGFTPMDEPSTAPNPKRWQRDRDPIPRDYVQQPPLIPHSVEGYKINRKFNKCLTCHSWSNYRQADATKISQTHFENRNHNVMANVAARRYFCTQCHVSQVDANPLVENTFQPVQVLQGAR